MEGGQRRPLLGPPCIIVVVTSSVYIYMYKNVLGTEPIFYLLKCCK
jgi:hypothetical protein